LPVDQATRTKEESMKVFVAGASGTIGRRLVPLLVANGYEVVGMTRASNKADVVRALGAQPVVADAFDRTSLGEALIKARPEVVVHEMTGLSGFRGFKNFDDELALTNRLRTEGTDNLLDAARSAGVRRMVAQSYGLWNYEVADRATATEDDPLDPSPPATMRRTLDAVRHVESAVGGGDGIEGLALRYGFVYGPGAGLGADGDILDHVGRRKLPIIGDGAGVWSFVHVDDAATATLAAIRRGAPGVYNIADDEPAPVATWLPELAEVIGARRPRRVPRWLGRRAAGEAGVYVFTRTRGMSNGKARRKLGWRPRYVTWREGFRHGLGAPLIEPGEPSLSDRPAA
jgi:nucleoside-diphosphate-sugar epimerase